MASPSSSTTRHETAHRGALRPLESRQPALPSAVKGRAALSDRFLQPGSRRRGSVHHFRRVAQAGAMVLELILIDQGDRAVAPSEHIQIETDTGQAAIPAFMRGG